MESLKDKQKGIFFNFTLNLKSWENKRIQYAKSNFCFIAYLVKEDFFDHNLL